VYSIECAVFLVPLKRREWGVEWGRQARIWSVVVKLWWVEVGGTVAVNLLWGG
jgi:hypothetical protein